MNKNLSINTNMDCWLSSSRYTNKHADKHEMIRWNEFWKQNMYN